MNPILLHRGPFDPTSGVIDTPEGPIRLSGTESRLLAHLAAHPHRVHTVEDLHREVWGYRPGVETRTAYVTIARLRAKIERDATNPEHIVAFRQHGYRFLPREVAAEPGLLARARALIAELEGLGFRVEVQPARLAG